MRLTGLRWMTAPPSVIGPDAAKEIRPETLAPLGSDRLGFALAKDHLVDLGPRSPTREFAAFSLNADATPTVEAATPSPTADPPDLLPTHGPPLASRDEVTFLLQIAAEIEHALMVQYLYAAYSLDPQASGLTPAQGAQVAKWKLDILAIGKEEMGHFISVQNILIS